MVRNTDDMLKIAEDVDDVVRRLRSLLHVMEQLGFSIPPPRAEQHTEGLEAVARRIRSEVARYPVGACDADESWDEAAAQVARLRQSLEVQEGLARRAALSSWRGGRA